MRSMKVFLRDLRLPARLGVHSEEHEVDRMIRIDIELGIKQPERAVATDDLDSSVDYAGLVAIAQEVIGRRHYHLVESLAHTVAESVLLLESVTWVRVRLEKPGCVEGAAAAGAEVLLCLDQDSDCPDC